MSGSRPLRAPSPCGAWREARGIVELLRLAGSVPHLLSQPSGDGKPVMLIPGYGSGDRGLSALRRYLRHLGHDARGWGLGRNNGNPEAQLPSVIEAVEALAAETQSRASLIGWSLGGVLAREVARERPDLVARVVTLGTPLAGGPAFTIFGERYRRRGFDLDAIQAEIDRRNESPIQVPVTTVIASGDAIVDPEACVDRLNERAHNVTVSTSHIGLLWSPDVYHLVANVLARPGDHPTPAEAA